MSSLQYTESCPSLPALLSRVESRIDGVWESERGFIGLAARRVLSGRGKRLRPGLVLLAAECAGGAQDSSVSFAAVVEIIHTASLVHDDVLDGALSRRGRRSAKAAWGNKVSVLLGDYLIARAFDLLTEIDRERLAPELAEVARRMCEGQIQELRLAGKVISERQYLDIVRAKTGRLFGLCGQGGVLTAGGDAVLAGALAQYGEEFGFAFQVADDILDLVGTNGRSGKQRGRDLAERKVTLPLILAAKRSRQARAQLAAVLEAEQITPEALKLVQDLADSTHALEDCWAQVHAALARARATLHLVPDSPAKEALYVLAGERFPLPVMN